MTNNPIPSNLGPLQAGGAGSSHAARGGVTPPVDGKGFKEFLLQNLDKVNQMQVEADHAVEGLVTGRETDITKVMGAVEKADVAFQTLMAVRGKLIDSYQEILRMRI